MSARGETAQRFLAEEGKMRSSTLTRTSSSLLLLVFTMEACRRHAPEPEKVDTLVFALDTSLSGRSGDRCGEVGAYVKEALASKSSVPLDILVLATGDVQEPITLVPWTSFAPSERLYGDNEAEAGERERFLSNVVARCRGAIQRSKRSPVLQLARRANEAVRAHCAELARYGKACGQKPVLVLASDLRETEVRPLVSALAGTRQRRSNEKVPTLDTEGIDLRVCGFSATDQAQGGADVVEVWRGVLGLDATFDPVCRLIDVASSSEIERR